MDALFSPVLLLLFFPALDKRLDLWLIKHVFWSRVRNPAHVCVAVCMQMRVRTYRHVGVFVIVHVGAVLYMQRVYLPSIVFSFDLPLVSSHYASTGV